MYDIEESNTLLGDWVRLIVAIVLCVTVMILTTNAMLQYPTRDGCEGKARRLSLTCSSIQWDPVDTRCQCYREDNTIYAFSTPYIWD